MKVTRQRTPLGHRFVTACEELTTLSAKVGWMESAVYPDGTPVAYVAAIQEYGAPSQGIPSRSFMRTTEAAELANWQQLMGEGAAACLSGTHSARAVLEAVSNQAKGDIQKTISELTQPKLSPVTVLLRKWRREGRTITGATVGEAARALAGPNPPDTGGVSDKPLNDSGYMLATITNEVVDR